MLVPARKGGTAKAELAMNGSIPRAKLQATPEGMRTLTGFLIEHTIAFTGSPLLEAHDHPEGMASTMQR